MPDIARMYANARRRYELGRALSAFRVAFVVVPLAALCARETGEVRRCALVGGALLMAGVAARWRQYRGVHAVDAGLLTGILPMSAALVLCRFAASWRGGAALGACTAAGFVAGAVAGYASGSRAADAEVWMTVALVAGLTAALGCVGIGIGTTIGTTAAVTLGTIAGALAVTSGGESSR